MRLSSPLCLPFQRPLAQQLMPHAQLPSRGNHGEFGFSAPQINSLGLLTAVNRHKLTNDEKSAYLKAQKCIMTSPAKLNKLPGAKTRWDELASLHQLHALQIHSTGTFLPYHRYFLHIHDFLLAECGYTGGHP